MSKLLLLLLMLIHSIPATFRGSLDSPPPQLLTLLPSLAVSHALETTDIGSVPCTIGQYKNSSLVNPYHLPWVMRGLLEEDLVKTELSDETAALLRQFDEWKPTTKALKDVKYRLEAVRSRL